MKVGRVCTYYENASAQLVHRPDLTMNNALTLHAIVCIIYLDLSIIAMLLPTTLTHLYFYNRMQQQAFHLVLCILIEKVYKGSWQTISRYFIDYINNRLLENLL